MVAARVTGLAKLLGLCVVAGVLVAAVLFPVVGGVGLMSNRASESVDQISSDLVSVDPPQVTSVLDKNGKVIASLFEQDRTIVRSEDISPNMKAAIVAVEDRRFYDHNGVDWQGIFRAAVDNVVQEGDGGGGSSLTQQYVKNYLAYVVARTDDERGKATERSIARKLREARIALQLEREVKDKDEILTRYLNIVPFGGQIYGVASAARTYFNTSPKDLTIPQAAFLAGLANQPSRLNPVNNPEGAVKRRNWVIDKMAENKAFPISDPAKLKQEVDNLKATELGTQNPLRTLSNGCVGTGGGNVNGFFCAYVVDYLQKAGMSLEQIKRGGYTIKTTLDPVATEAAKSAAEGEVSKTTDGIANVIAVVQPGKDKHRVVALAANRDYGIKQDLGQTSYRLPSDVAKFGAGSIFKVFTATAAMEEGKAGINTSIPTPPTYTSPVYKNGGRGYTVKNAGEYGESMSLQQALALSPNTGFIWLEERAGLGNVVDMSIKLGLRNSMQGVNNAGTKPNPDSKNRQYKLTQEQLIKQDNSGSFTLGVTPVSPLELANVGATLTSGGVWCPPSPIEQILDRSGKPVPFTEAGCEQVISPDLAASMAQALSKDDQGNGTSAAAARAAGWDRPMLGKTGTTQDHKSAGFLGATPQYSGAVLTFSDSDSPRPICDGAQPYLCRSGNIYGGKVPARTWFEAMKKIHKDKKREELPPAAPSFMN
ncbi:transglycosylase domain-containing protein [Allokutzneria oryzae]|uniref:Transglycosylase domain-containing protein n=1 Tax=Allokutzneria oryzae TaxID=1378989 RepID=A0ABV6A8N5_9PSEU